MRQLASRARKHVEDGRPRFPPTAAQQRRLVAAFADACAGGDIKLYGTGVDEQDPGLRAEFCRVIQARIDWQPTEPYHLFSLDVTEAAYIRFTDEYQYIWRWTPSTGLHQDQKPNQ